MKKMTRKLLIIAVYIGIILISTNTYATSAKIISDKTRLRKEPNTNSSVVTVVSKDTEIEIIEEKGEWYKVRYSGKTGYIRKDLISVEEEKKEETSTTEEKENETEQISENGNEEESNQEKKEEVNKEQTAEVKDSQILQKGYSGKLTDKLEIKILPLINSSVIASLDENTQFTVTDIINKWCYIETENSSGWVLLGRVQTEITENNEAEEQKQDVEEKEEKTKEESDKKEEKPTSSENKEKSKYVSTETLNLREKAENNANIITKLSINTQVTVIEEVDSTWSKVKVKGKTGYVASKYLSDSKVNVSTRSEDTNRKDNTSSNEGKEKNNSTEKKEQTNKKTETKEKEEKKESSSSANGAKVVEYAKNYLGCKYVAGGASPNSGFDCSGFTSYVYKNFGVNLSRASKAQASNGVEVSKSDLKEGDLLIFRNSSNSAVGHVGIYMGGNKFIHAANASKGVITTSLSDSYYSKRYVTARRVIN